MKKLLIVEDDPHIAELIREKLKDEPFDISLEANGKKAFAKAIQTHYDVILLDVMLPEMNGTEICKQLRTNNIRSVIIMLTAKSEEIDKVVGLELGADDYITKPFSPRELLSRIHARMRRVDQTLTAFHGDQNSLGVLKFGDLDIDTEKRKVARKGKIIDLTPKEFDLLVVFSSKPGKTYTRLQLLDRVWGTNFEGFEHTVNSHINRLRAKIETDPANPEYILTTWGVGYRFKD